MALPPAADARLKAAGATYYAWHSQSLPESEMLSPDAQLVRLVTSFATTHQDVDCFVAIAREQS